MTAFIRSLQLEEYSALLAAAQIQKSARQSKANEELPHVSGLVDQSQELNSLVNEVAVLEFRLMFKRAN